MRSLCDGLLVYSGRQKLELEQAGIRKPIFVATNAIYPKAEMTPVARGPGSTGVIYVGRMVPDKKIELLLEGFYRALPRLPEDTLLHLVGDGPLVGRLTSIADQHGIGHRVLFHGHVSDYGRLAELYSASLVSASPGYAGLSLTQSFGFGVPVLIARDEPHSPEIAAARDGENSCYFESDNPESLAEALVEQFSKAESWKAAAAEISENCASCFSLESMTAAFRQALDALAPLDGVEASR